MIRNEELLERIEKEFKKNQELSGSKLLNKVARTVYSLLPETNADLLQFFDFLVSQEESKLFWLVTTWIKRREFYDLEHFETYENWLYKYVNRWGVCDIFCYRVLNPMVEKYPQLFEKAKEWADSSKTYVRRAAPVSLIKSTRSFEVNYPLEKVLLIAEKLKHDKEIHVQKGVGWLLKYAYLSYPEEIITYLKENVDNLPRVIFRYALEKVPEKTRAELMNL